MVGRRRADGGGRGGARKGTGPKPKMDAESIAKREKKALRKAAKASLAAFVECEQQKIESEQLERCNEKGLRVRSSSSKQQPGVQAGVQAGGSSTAAASSSSTVAAAAPAAASSVTLLSFFSKKSV